MKLGVAVCLVIAAASCSPSSDGQGDEAPTAPAGSYQSSCLGCSVQASVLTCLCGAGDGSDRKTTLTLPCTHDIANCEGTLTCGSCGGGGSGDDGCKNDSDCSSKCGSDCYQCYAGSCSCGYEGVSGCVF